MPAPVVSPLVRLLSDYAWRLLVLAAGVVAVLVLLGRLRTVVFPVVIALLLSRVLWPVASRLRRRGAPGAVSAAVALLTFLVVIVGGAALIAPVVANEFSDLGPTLTEAVDDLERWIVDDSGLDITQADIDRARAQLSERIRATLTTSGSDVVQGAVLVAELLAGLVIALFITFFALKDGERFQRWSLSFLPPAAQPRTRRLATLSWDAIGGYLRGAALLGLLEGVVITLTLTLVGASLAVPVGVITFVAAFVPFVGAIVAGVVAVLVALASAGPSAALIVAVVAIVVQQLDNDLLAPVIYGRTLRLHPAAVILSVAAGGALFGLAGTFLAVPVAAVISAIGSEVRSPYPVAEPSADGGERVTPPPHTTT